MNILTFTQARASLKTVMDDVCKDHTPTIISSVSGEHVVMLSLTDFNSMQETLYLLSSPANANHLMESIAQLKAGKSQPRELIRNEKPKKQKQTANSKQKSAISRGHRMRGLITFIGKKKI
jgi:antitoxin YefM